MVRLVKKLALSLLLVISCCTLALADASVWKARKGETVLYLGGTFHMLRPSDYPLPAEYETAYRASQVVVFETDIGQLQTAETQQRMLAGATYPDGSTVDRHLSPKAWQELTDYCQANGVPLEVFSRFKPSMIMATLSVMELMKLGVTREGVDVHFYQRAKKDRKGVKRLETVDRQIEYILSMGEGNESDFVSYSLEDFAKVKEEFEALAAAWRAGNAAKLDELLIAEFKSRYPALYKKLILERNRAWLPMIEAYAQTPRVKFILVGTAHLVGPDGLIAALKSKGFKVEKL